MRIPARTVLRIGPIDIDNAVALAPPLLVGAPPLTSILGLAHAVAREIHRNGIPAFPEAYAAAIAARSDLRILSRRGRQSADGLAPAKATRPNPFGDARIDLRISFLLAYGGQAAGGPSERWRAGSDEMIERLLAAARRLAPFLRQPLLRGMAVAISEPQALPSEEAIENRPFRRALAWTRFIAKARPRPTLPEAAETSSHPAAAIFRPQDTFLGYVLPTVVGYDARTSLQSDGRRSLRSGPHREARIAEPLYAPVELIGVRAAFGDPTRRIWWRPSMLEPNIHLWETLAP